MSKLEDKIYKLILEALPNYTCIRQYYVDYLGNRLFFDFYIVELMLMIEVHGKQHYEYNRFHFSTPGDFKRQQIRDRLKEDWCIDNGYAYICIKYDKVDTLSAHDLKDMIVNN